MPLSLTQVVPVIKSTQEQLNFSTETQLDSITISLPHAGRTQDVGITSKISVADLRHKYPGRVRTLRLKVGQIKELADGVFVKKTADDALELYISRN